MSSFYFEINQMCTMVVPADKIIILVLAIFYLELDNIINLLCL